MCWNKQTKPNHTSLASCQMCIITPQRHKIVISFNTLISNIFLNWHFFLQNHSGNQRLSHILAIFLFFIFLTYKFLACTYNSIPYNDSLKKKHLQNNNNKKHSFCLWLLATESYQKKQAYKALTKRYQTHIN